MKRAADRTNDRADADVAILRKPQFSCGSQIETLTQHLSLTVAASTREPCVDTTG